MLFTPSRRPRDKERLHPRRDDARRLGRGGDQLRDDPPREVGLQEVQLEVHGDRRGAQDQERGEQAVPGHPRDQDHQQVGDLLHRFENEQYEGK